MSQNHSNILSFIELIMDNMEMCPNRVILGVLRFHVGRDNAISRIALLSEVQRKFKIDDRVMREHINELRKSLAPMICSSGGEGGGYYLPANKDELVEYYEHEVLSRAMDFHAQEKALKRWLENFWGRYSPEKQTQMFQKGDD